MPSGRNLPVGAGTSALAIVPEANVSGEIARAGVAFGDLVQTTGMAVAETQNRLNTTSAASATALATTQVDVIAVQEKIYDDQGNITHMVSHMRRLPLINFIDPVFYQWNYVRLQGEFVAREFASAATSYRNGWTSSSKSGQGGLLVILGGGRTTMDYSSTTTTTSAEATEDISYGRVRMNALLTPRSDVSVPKPAQVLRGPNLAIVQGEITDLRDGAAGPLTGRTMSVMLEYRRRDGAPIANKLLSIDTQGATWEYVGTQTTSAAGQVEILLTRTFLDPEADTTPTDVIITARIGLVQNSTSVTF
ncbi:MAG: hypothetical protein HY911_00905 [Desulfobacterales bacterium]|nr:hypothetical protein [Desulfobacterales bacterium]